MHYPLKRFNRRQIALIRNNTIGIVNLKSSKTDFNPQDVYQNKGESDAFIISFWNDIFPKDFHITDIGELKSSASELIKMYDKKYPNGHGMSEAQYIHYIQAQSSSSYIGIQNPSKSQFSMDSMLKTIQSHGNPKIVHKPWLFDNLKRVIEIINRNRMMDVDYSDVIMSAKSSSASVRDGISFRDMVLGMAFDDIVSQLDKVPLLIYMGTRLDRRGKYRLICSFDGRFRVIDFMVNHGIYALFEMDGILSPFTTEGYNNAQIWRVLKVMSDRSSGRILVCIDYASYDTQLGLDEYLELAILANQYRMKDPVWSYILGWYIDWMEQPKPLVVNMGDKLEVVVPCYVTLASGLHGTHSHENWFGVATYLEALNRGVVGHAFWSNGDDQNALIDSSSLSKYIDFLNEYYSISWDKSLTGHALGVWGKLWFAADFHPMWEIGTIRSIWEREGGQVNYVEDSKFQSNYCKVLQYAITFIRLGKSEAFVRDKIHELCEIVGIDPERLPSKLSELNYSSSKSKASLSLHGLESVKKELMAKTFHFKALNANNYYDMLQFMAVNRVYFSLDPQEVKYLPKGSSMYIKRGLRYNVMVPRDVPWVFKNLYLGEDFSPEDMFVRDVLQGTKSYDGPCPVSYEFHDLYTLAVAINNRNRYMWQRIERDRKSVV